METALPAKITVLIPTFNEAGNVLAAIESVRWADEILVVDSFSTDDTVNLARNAGARVLEHEYVNSATQKNWAIPQATHSWVMVLDADERVTPALAEEIKLFLTNRTDRAGLRIFRRNFFMGKPIRYCGWQDDSVLRVFLRDHTRYLKREVHADAIIEGGTIEIARNRMDHYTFTSFAQYMKKFDQYTTWAAGDRGKRTKRVTALHLLGRPFWRFFKQYFLRLGILDGRAGLVICMLSAFSAFLKYAKLWERQQNEALIIDSADQAH